MSPKLLPLFRPGVLPHEGAGDCPRERLICAYADPPEMDARWSLLCPVRPERRWMSEGDYRMAVAAGARMVVLEER